MGAKPPIPFFMLVVRRVARFRQHRQMLPGLYQFLSARRSIKTGIYLAAEIACV
jgi:hypothetical protein